MNKKKCAVCGSSHTVKNGIRKGVQLYKCQECGYQFRAGVEVGESDLWNAYQQEKQTIKELSERYVRNDATHYIEGYSFRHNESVASGFGVTVGISYDYSITRNWSVGVLYERGLNICEHNIFGMHVRYSF